MSWNCPELSQQGPWGMCLLSSSGDGSSCPFFISPDFQQALSLFRMTKMNMSAFIANHCPAKMEFWKDVLPASLIITSNSFFLVYFMASPFSVPQIISLCDQRVFLKTEFSSSVTMNFINIRWRTLSALNIRKSILQSKEGCTRRKQWGENPTTLKEVLETRLSCKGLNYQK